MMTLAEFNRLKHMMMLTTSANDHEALAALRKANEVLASFKYTWDEVFKRLVKVDSGLPDVEDAPDERDERQLIREAFTEVEMTDLRGSFADFIASLKEQWESKNYLSPAQKEALFKAARKTHR